MKINRQCFYLLFIILCIFLLPGCKKEEAAAPDQASVPGSTEALSADWEMVWRGTELALSDQDQDYGLSFYDTQLSLEDGTVVLTCTPNRSGEEPHGLRFTFPEGPGGKAVKEEPDYLRESADYGRVISCEKISDESFLLLYLKEKQPATGTTGGADGPGKGNSAYTLRRYSPSDGVYTELTQTLPEGADFSRATLLSDDTLVVFDSEDYMAYAWAPGVSEFTSRFKASYRCGFLELGDGTLCVRPSYQEGYCVIDVKTGTKTEDFAPASLFTVNAGKPSRLIKSGENFFLINGSGVYHKKAAKAEWEPVLYAQETVLYDPSFYVRAFLPEGNGFYIASDRTLYYYEPVPMKKADRQTLTVVSCTPDPLIQKAAVAFSLGHPEIRVNLEVMVEDEFADAQTIEEARRLLNTQIISGKKMDVLTGRDMDYEAYGEKGLLKDLAALAADVTADGSCYTEAVKGCEKDGRLYASAVGFSPVGLAVKDSLPEETASELLTLAGLNDYLSAHADATVFAPQVYAGPEALSRLLFELYFPQTLDADGRVVKEQLRLYLAALQTLNTRMAQYPKGNIHLAYLIKEAEFLSGEDSPAQAALITEYITAFSSVLKTPGLYLLPTDRYEPGSMAALCSRSENEEAAEAFFRFLYSEKVQDQVDTFQLPVRRSSMEKLLIRQAEGYEAQGLSGQAAGGGTAGSAVTYLEKEDIPTLLSLYEQARQPFLRLQRFPLRKDLYRILADRSEGLLQERTSLEETLEDVYEGITLYEEEQTLYPQEQASSCASIATP